MSLASAQDPRGVSHSLGVVVNGAEGRTLECMAHFDWRLVRGFRDRAMRTLLVGTALGAILVASVAAAAPGAATLRMLATRGPLLALAADGNRVALVIRSNSSTRFRGVCAGVVVWEPIRHRVVRLQRPCGPRADFEDTRSVALADTRVAWLSAAGADTLEMVVRTATLARPIPVWLAYASAHSGFGDFVHRPVGDGTLLAFTIDENCEEGEFGSPPCPPAVRRATSSPRPSGGWRAAAAAAPTMTSASADAHASRTRTAS